MTQNLSFCLSKGATAGIVIAAVLVGLGLIAGLALILVRWKRHTVAEADTTSAVTMPSSFYSAYNAPPVGQAVGMLEMYTLTKDLNTTLHGYYSSGTRDTRHGV